MQLESTTGVQVADQTGIIDSNTVTKGKEVRLGEKDAGTTVGVYRTVLSNVRTQEAVVPGNVGRARDHGQETNSVIAVFDQRFAGKEELPALVVAALVPVVGAFLATTHDRPFDAENDAEGKGDLNGGDDR